MTRRGWLQSAGLALFGGTLALASRGRAVAAGMFRVTHSDAEWRQLLTPAQYQVLRQQGTEPPESSPLDHQFGRGRYLCTRMRAAAVCIGDEIRQRHRLAQFLRTIEGCCGNVIG